MSAIVSTLSLEHGRTVLLYYYQRINQVLAATLDYRKKCKNKKVWHSALKPFSAISLYYITVNYRGWMAHHELESIDPYTNQRLNINSSSRY